MRTNIRTAIALLGVTAGACSFGCGGKISDAVEPTGVGRVALRRAQSCEDLRQMLAQDAIAKVNARIDQEIQWTRSGYGYGGSDGAWFGGSNGEMDTGGAALPNAGAGGAGDGAASGLDDQSSGSGAVPPRADGQEQASSHSETNTQVAGVDEADIVKTDGKHLFLLHGRTLQILDAWPAVSLAKGPEVALEGEPLEMFVEDGRAIVYSTVDGAPIYQAANVTPKPGYDDYGYGYGGAVEMPTTAPGAGTSSPAPYPGGKSTYAPLTKVTVIQLDAAAPAVSAELYFEGDYLSSRRVGDEIRTVLRGGAHGPSASSDLDANGDYSTPERAIASLEKLRAKSIAAIQATPVNDWLPYRFVKSGDAVTATTPQCDEYYVPTAGSTRYGLTQLQVFDASAPTSVHGASIVGDAETVYSNATTLYVAAASSEESAYAAATTQTAPVAITRQSTHLHKFDLASTPGQPRYVASGTVAGTVKDQFSLDERGGFLRVATTEDRVFFFPGGGGSGDSVSSGGSGGGVWGGSAGGASVDPTVPAADAGMAVPAEDGGMAIPDEDGGSSIPEQDAGTDTPEQGGGEDIPLDGGAAPSANPTPRPSKPLDGTLGPSRVNHLFVLGQEGDELELVGSAGDLAPEERIYSTRFVGDRGYVVTFRQVDPLFVIDLADPTKPTVMAELKIPGFSEYMHPLDDGYLLTIGKDTKTNEWGGVQTSGLALQIFDVRDAKTPKLLHKYAFDDASGRSDASYDHKAFTYFADRKLLAFPYVTYNTDFATQGYGMRSSLEVFSIDTQAGITPVGSIDHTALVEGAPNGYCGSYYGIDVRRGVFLDDFIYSISYGGVVVNDVADLEHPVASVALPQPVAPGGYCGGEYMD